MPQLRSLYLAFCSWPTILSHEEDLASRIPSDDSEGDPASPGDEQRSDIPPQVYVNPNLRSVNLESLGKHSADADSSAFASMLGVVPVLDNPGSRISYTVRGNTESYDNCFQVLWLSDFVPTALCVQWQMSSFCGPEAMRILARDDSGNERSACARKTKEWNGRLLLQYLDTSRVTSLVIDDVEWDAIADGFEAPVLESLEIVLDSVAGWEPPSLHRRKINLPCLRRVSFTLDDMVKRRASRPWDAGPLKLDVRVALLEGFLTAALPREGWRLDEIVIKDPAMLLIPVEDGGDPLKELGRFSRSVVVL